MGWARLSLQAAEGTGYNLSASELAAGLALMGHRVVYLSSGMRYSLVPGMRIVRTETWRGVECFDLINSPNLSPSAANFRNPLMESSSAKQSRLVVDFLRRHNADLVHSHSLEGQGLDLIGAIKDAGMGVVVTLHNYWHLCPQVDLLHDEHELCLDYDGGRRCEGCLSADRPATKRLKRAVIRSIERIVGPKQTELFKHKSKRLMRRVRSIETNEVSEASTRRVRLDPELALGHTVSGVGDGTVDHGFAPGDRTPRKPVRLHIDENERCVQARDVHLRVLNSYGRRRLAGVGALNRADRVTPPSEFNARLHEAMGVEAERIQVVRYGQPHFDQINRRARRSPFYDRVPWEAASATRPLRFGFFGTVRPNKGLEVLLRAIEGLEPAVRRRCQFVIRASGGDWPMRRRMSKYPEVNFLGGYDLIQLIAAGGEYDVGILPHIWFDNSPLVMWEHLHAGKPVIAARLGGAADTIKPIDTDPPGNGVFFAGGCPDELAERITQFATGAIEIPTARQIHEVSTLTTYPEHVREVDAIYQDILNCSKA